ncbi:hypothetical protein V8E54_011166 [Elaphomyces granulatus]
MKRLKSSTRQGCSVLGKRSHDDNDDGRIFDSDYNEDDFGEAVEGEEPEGYSSDDDQTVHGLVRHFLEAGEDGGLPLGLDLEAIQLEDQYQNTEYGPVSKMQSQRLDSTSMKLMTPIWIWNHRLLLCRLWDHRLVLYRR